VLNTSQGAATSNGNQESANERDEHKRNATDHIAKPQTRPTPSFPEADENFSSKNFSEKRTLPNRPVPRDEAPLSDQNDTTRLWREALRRLLEDKSKQKIMDKYKEIADPELVNNGLAPSSASPPDQQRVEDWLKRSESSPSSKGGEILGNVAKALSFAAQLLSPAAAVEPHVGLVYAGLCVLMQVCAQLFGDHTSVPSLLIRLLIASILMFACSQFSMLRNRYLS
jgi:hypothetical protein